MPRRSKGEGNLKHRKDGRKEWRFWVETPDGNFYRKSIIGKTVKIANQKKKDFLKNLEKELIPTDRLIVDYLYRASENPTLAKATRKNYKVMINNYIESVIPRVKLIELEATHIKKIYKAMKDRGCGLSSQTLVKAILSKGLKDAVIEGLIDINPMTRVADHPTQPSANPNPLELDEQETLLTSETNPEYKNIWIVAMDTGMRRGELFGLKWSDIDFDRTVIKDGKKVHQPVIKIQRQYHQIFHEFAEPKRGSAREVVLLPSVAEALESQRRIILEKQLKARLWVDNDLVFTNDVGEPKNGNKANGYLGKRLKELNIKHRKFHDFRATFATNCVRQGVHIKTVQKWLGHADIKTTLNIYSLSTPEMEVEGALRMAQLDRKVS